MCTRRMMPPEIRAFLCGRCARSPGHHIEGSQSGRLSCLIEPEAEAGLGAHVVFAVGENFSETGHVTSAPFVALDGLGHLVVGDGRGKRREVVLKAHEEIAFGEFEDVHAEADDGAEGDVFGRGGDAGAADLELEAALADAGARVQEAAVVGEVGRRVRRDAGDDALVERVVERVGNEDVAAAEVDGVRDRLVVIKFRPEVRIQNSFNADVVAEVLDEVGAERLDARLVFQRSKVLEALDAGFVREVRRRRQGMNLQALDLGRGLGELAVGVDVVHNARLAHVFDLEREEFVDDGHFEGLDVELLRRAPGHVVEGHLDEVAELELLRVGVPEVRHDANRNAFPEDAALHFAVHHHLPARPGHRRVRLVEVLVEPQRARRVVIDEDIFAAVEGQTFHGVHPDQDRVARKRLPALGSAELAVVG
mmetsp:Transcript_26763/g.82178  ORF Transcript_26763/g.82178 Transcript_26763/m.82178 type:complete len:422 (+) Transcript_26763:177-1442(+)